MRFQVLGFRFQVLGFRFRNDAMRRAGRRGRRPLPRAHGVGPYHAPHGRARRPRRAAYMGTPSWTPSRTPTAARAAEDVGPYHAHMVPARTTHPMVGRDVPGAPRIWKRPRGRHQAHGPPGTSAPPTRHMVSARSTHPMVGRDVLGAPRTWKRPRGRHQARGPPRTSAPPTRTWCRPVPRTHPSAHGVGAHFSVPRRGRRGYFAHQPIGHRLP